MRQDDAYVRPRFFTKYKTACLAKCFLSVKTKLRMISVGDADHVWALDTSDKLYMRQETSSPAFPEVINTIMYVRLFRYIG